MLNLHLLECTLKGYDHISDLLLAKYWVITGCKYLDCKNLSKIYCYATIPPSIGSGAFNSISNNAKLYVPSGCKAKYVDSDWGIKFSNIEVMNWN